MAHRETTPGSPASNLRDAGKTLRIDDAIPWSDGVFLVATDAGLRRYVLATLKLSRIDLPEPPQPATRLIRDGRGRLWLGGQGLWLVDAAMNALESARTCTLELVEVQVYALALDPDHDDGCDRGPRPSRSRVRSCRAKALRRCPLASVVPCEDARTLAVGNGAGFWGDNLDAPYLLARDGQIDVLRSNTSPS